MPDFKKNDHVKCIRSAVRMLKGTIHQVESILPDKYGIGDDGLKLVGREDEDDAWRASRFELYKFKVGDMVRRRDGMINMPELTVGSLYTIVKDQVRTEATIYDDNGRLDSYSARNFDFVSHAGAVPLLNPFGKMVVEARVINPVTPFKVGQSVRIIDPILRGDLIPVGTTVIVSNITFGEAGWIITFNYKGVDRKWKSTRFVRSEFGIGDWVFITQKVEINGKGHSCGWAKEMNRLLNNGVAYKVVSVLEEDRLGKRYHLENGWTFLPECLTPEVVGQAAPLPEKPKAPPIPKPKPIPVNDIRALLKEKVSKVDTSGLCAIGVEYVDGQTWLSDHMACHYQLGALRNTPIKALAYGLSHEHRHMTKSQISDHRKYVDYILNRSPWAKCFITKDVDEAFEKDILMDVSQPRHHIAGACVSLREASEHHGKLSTFITLLEMGHHEHTAHMLSFCYTITDGKIKVLGTGDWHRGMCGSLNMVELIKFFKGGFFLGLNEKPFSENHDGYRVQSYIASFEAPSFADWLANNVKSKLNGKGFGAVGGITIADLSAAGLILDEAFQ